MSLVQKDNGKKWIQSGLAIACMLIVYIFIKFFNQMGEWFELESKINSYTGISQFIAVAIAFGVFVFVSKNHKTKTFLEEVYAEASKVVWPDKNDTVKHTIAIMIGVSIVGTLLAVFDLVASWLLSLIN